MNHDDEGLAMEKCIERIQLHMPTSLYHDILKAAARADLSASAYLRRMTERVLYGELEKEGAHRCAKERRDA